MSFESVADLIREVGVHRLGGYDGCPCTNFAVRGVVVEVGCRKSSGMSPIDPDFFGIGLRVWSRSLDVDAETLEAVAREVASQMEGHGGYAVKVRYCSYEADAKRQCVYCGKPRSDVNGYLCNECLVKVSPFGDPIADSYDMRRHEFAIEEAA